MKYRRRFLALADRLHLVTAVTCAILLFMIFAVQFLVVMLRYAFAVGFLELQDTVAYCFACLVVLGVPVALRLDRHVRVDIFRESQSAAIQRRVDIAAVLLLLAPVFATTFYFALPGILYSWRILEGSVETGGLPGYFIIKSMLPVSCTLMVIQGLAMILGAGKLPADGGNGP